MTNSVFSISVKKGRDVVGVEGWGVVEGFPPNKNHFSQNDVWVYFDAVFNTDSPEAMRHGFDGSIGKRSLQKSAK